MWSSSANARLVSAVRLVLVLVIATLVTGRAAAKKPEPLEQPRISIQLNTPDGSLPDYLCVVGRAGIATVPLDVAFAGQKGQTFEPLSKSAQTEQEAARVEQHEITELTQTLQKDRAPSTPPNTALPHEDEIAEARAALGRSVRGREPSCGRSLCDARLEEGYDAASPARTTPLRVACRRESSARKLFGERPSVVVVALEFYKVDKTEPMITNLEYDKKGVINLDAFLPQDLVTAKVVGGHYAARSYAQSEVDAQGHHRISLSLTPLCAEREVALSDFTPADGRVKVSLDVSNAPESSACRAGQGVKRQLVSVEAEVQPERTVRVVLPVGLEGEKQLRIESPDPESPSYFRALVSWSAPEPPRALTPRFEAVSFRWRRHCSFPSEPGNECPDAVLPEAGVECKAPTLSKQGVCAYRCERPQSQREARDFSLPTVVQFSASGRAWDADLLRPNMLLTTYLSREEEFVRVRFPKWTDADVRSAKDVQLMLPSGGYRTLPTQIDGDAGAIVEIAGACNTDVHYLLIGDRRYVDQTIQIEHGILNIPRPSESARLGRLRARVGYAQSFQLENPGDWQGEKKKHWAEIRAELGVNLRPNNWAFSFEPHLGMLLTWREFYDIRRDDTVDHPNHSVAYLNFVLGGTFYFHPLTDVAVGAGLQCRWGTPLHSNDRPLVGTVDLAVGPGLSAVYQSWRNIALWVDLYYLASEQVRAFETDFRGQPRTLQSSRNTLVLGGGLTFGIF